MSVHLTTNSHPEQNRITQRHRSQALTGLQLSVSRLVELDRADGPQTLARSKATLPLF